MSRTPRNFAELDIANELAIEELTQADSQSIVHFYRCATICNALVPIVNESDTCIELDYVTVYPEEEVMLRNARKFGFNLLDVSEHAVKFSHNKQEVEYEVIGRSCGRSSILVKTEEGKGVLYAKGSPAYMMSKLCDRDQTSL